MTTALQTRAGLAACVAMVLAIWMLRYPYGGIVHDASLYTFLALARLHPDSLAADVFLRYGSQDHYTLFSPVFAAFIDWLDLEPAAALLTFVSHIAFFVAAFLLARRLMTAQHAALAMGLLIALPSAYGVGDFFNYIESFLTPRQMTQALVLVSLVCGLSHRPVAATLSLVAGFLLHPIMALSGAVFLYLGLFALRQPKAGLLVSGFLLTAALVLCLLGVGPFAPFDAQWFELVHDYTPYLFMTQWPIASWNLVAIASALLLTGSFVIRNEPLQRICCAGLLTTFSGIAVTLIFGDWLHSVIFIQAQAWRWMWLVQFLAILVLPVLATSCWQCNDLTRAALLSLISAWLVRDSVAGLGITALAVGCAFAARRSLPPGLGRTIRTAAAGILVVSLTVSCATFLTDPLPAQNNPALPESGQLWVPAWMMTGSVLAAAVSLSWLAARRVTYGPGVAAHFILTAGLCAALASSAWTGWTHFHYTQALHSAFARWRAEIPPTAEVIWPGSPVGAWYLLERPSYYSIHQVAGDIFSRPKALEIHRRAAVVQAALSSGDVTGAAPPRPTLPLNADKLTDRGLIEICADPALRYVVSWSRLTPAAVDSVTPDPGKPMSQLHLYRCSGSSGP